MIRFTIITLFPALFSSVFEHSILRRAREKGLLSIEILDLRSFATDKHRVADDYAYGGGQGMVLKPEPLVRAIEHCRQERPDARVILLSPQGRVFDQAQAAELARGGELVLVCGRYEGVDERVKRFVDAELSIGDYTLSGGEIAAMVVVDAVARLLPGVLGNPRSAAEDSFAQGLLEYPQYTRPEEFRGLRVPEVLLSGDHERIRAWRRQMSLQLTAERRPDLLRRAELSEEERKMLLARRAPFYLALLHHPVYDKNRQIVTTAITNMDIHDIARSARTYGARAFYVLHPVKALRKLAAKIVDHWERGHGATYNETRKEALRLVRLRETLDQAIVEIESECGARPLKVATSARRRPHSLPFPALAEMLEKGTSPVLLLLGTGWGLTEETVAGCDHVLEPIVGGTDYNHLSVRAAAAILLDRLSRPGGL